MLNFLAPAALWGLALLAIPVLVHLFRPRKVRQTPFSSLRWLRATQQRLSRRIRWHQVLLFLLRAAFVTLLVLALARPLLLPAGSAARAERFIVLDVSRSMSYHAGEPPTPLERGKQIAADLVARQGPDDRTALLLTGTTTQWLWPLTRDAEARLSALAAVRGTSTDTDLGSALDVIKPAVSRRRDGAAIELFFISDNHQGAWSQGAVAAFTADLPGDVRVQIIDVGAAAPHNGWIADARLLQRGDPPRRYVRVEAACAGDTGEDRSVRLRLPGQPDQVQPVALEPGRPVRVEFELPADYDLQDRVAEIRLEPDDGLPSDDRFYLNLDAPAGLKVLLVEPESTAAESLRPGFHLRTAVEALAAASGHGLELTGRTSVNVTADEISAADVVFLVGVPDLKDADLTALEAHVRAGAGLAVFLGPDVRPPFYNARLYRALQPSEGLLPVALGPAETPAGGLAPLTDVRQEHPLFARMLDPRLGDLGQVRFRAYHRLPEPGKEDRVLARIDGDVPAVVERRVGAGTVLLFNTTANDAWSDLPRRKSFVPLVDRMLTHLSGGGARRTFTAGEAIALALPGMKPGEAVTVRTPGGEPLKVTATSGARPLLRLDPLDEPGVYRVERPSGKAVSFVLQVGKGDSVLTPIEPATLTRWWEPVRCEVIGADAPTRASSLERQALWPWLLGIGGLALLAEMFFVHWLCPRPSPVTVTASIVHRQGILARTGRSE